MLDKLPVPQEIIDYVDKVNKSEVQFACSKNVLFAETAQFIDSHWFVRIWAIRRKPEKDGTHPFKEIVRQSETTIWVSGSLLLIYNYGYKVLWDKVSYTRYGEHLLLDDELYEQKQDYKKPNIWDAHLWDDRIVKADPDLKYIYVPWDSDFIKFILAAKKYPSLEILEKMGFHQFYTDQRVLKLTGPKKKAFIQFLVKNKNIIQRNRICYSEIASCIRQNITIEEYRRRMSIMKKIVSSQWADADWDTKNEIYKYLCKQYEKKHPKLTPKPETVDVGLYSDYLAMAKELRISLKSHSSRFPADMYLAHDSVSKTLSERKQDAKIKEAKKLKQKIKATIKKFINKTQFDQIQKQLSESGLTFIIPNNYDEFIKRGNELNQCLATHGYFKKMADGISILVFINDGDKALETAEIEMPKKGHPKIIQLRGKNNQSSSRHEEIENLIKNCLLKKPSIERPVMQ